jgi:hypothetical protein
MSAARRSCDADMFICGYLVRVGYGSQGGELIQQSPGSSRPSGLPSMGENIVWVV